MAWAGGLWLVACPAAIAWFDYRHGFIANASLLLLCLPGLIWLIIDGRGMLDITWLSSGLGALVAALFLLPGFVGNMVGGGDVKLASALGFYLGPIGVLCMFGLATPIWLVLYWRLHGRSRHVRSKLPMAPALAAGLWMTLPLYLLRI